MPMMAHRVNCGAGKYEASGLPKSLFHVICSFYTQLRYHPRPFI